MPVPNAFMDKMVTAFMNELQVDPDLIIPPSVLDYYFRRETMALAARGQLPIPGVPLTHGGEEARVPTGRMSTGGNAIVTGGTTVERCDCDKCGAV